ncbi:MAG: tripartite tricarboxylate transporter substrate binding protein [Usitatibacter sp.]
MKSRLNALLAASLLLATGLACAQDDYPNKVVKIIVPYGAGGSTDVLTRIVAQRLGERLGKTVIVENRAGANGIIGADAAAKSAADGYTFLAASNGQVVNVVLKKDMPYDLMRDLVPVVNMAVMPNVLGVHPSQPMKTLKEVVEAARANPGSLAYGHAGVGSSQHLAGEIFRVGAKIEIRQIAYKGGGPAVADALGGHVPLVVAGLPAIAQHAKSGALRAVAVTGEKRSPQLPDVPTMQEQGYVNNEVFWIGLAAPRGTPPAVVARINTEVNAVLKMPEVAQQFAAQGAEATGGSAQQFDAFLRKELDNAAQIVREASIKPE